MSTQTCQYRDLSIVTPSGARGLKFCLTVGVTHTGQTGNVENETNLGQSHEMIGGEDREFHTVQDKTERPGPDKIGAGAAEGAAHCRSLPQYNSLPPGGASTAVLVTVQTW